MIWADRIGLGLAALVTLYAVYFIPVSLNTNHKDWVSYSAKIAACESYKKSHPEFSEVPSTREEYVRQRVESFHTPCFVQPEKPNVLTFMTQFTVILKLVAELILPLWIFLRVLDFVVSILRKRVKRVT
jgi:hypothetical protein